MEKIYQHFVQKASIKYWKDENNFINYVNFSFDKKIEMKKFKFDDKSKNHPIAEKDFYNEEIENKLNKIESNFIRILDKINKTKTFNYQNIRLTRKEVFTLKIYFVVNSIRTKKSRINIKNFEGNNYFNEFNKNIMDKYNLSDKEIQLEKIHAALKIYDCFINYYNNGLKNSLMDCQNNFNYKEIWNDIKKMIDRIFASRNVFISFKDSERKLLKTESGTFQEIWYDNIPVYDFFPLGKDFGVCFYQGTDINLNIPKKRDFIFPFDFKINKSSNKNPSEYKLNDKFTYTWHFGNENSVNLCNAMMMIHSDNSIIIASHKEDIKKSLEYMKKYKIYRIEDKY